MKRYLTLAVASLLLTTGLSIASPDSDALKEKETAAWQAYKDKKAEEFKKLAAPNFQGVYSEGIVNLDQEMKAMNETTFKSFELSDVKVVNADPNTATITYKVKIDGMQGGKDISGNYNAASVWLKQGADWRAILHTNVEIKDGDK
jgi:hypothetical protein